MCPQPRDSCRWGSAPNHGQCSTFPPPRLVGEVLIPPGPRGRSYRPSLSCPAPFLHTRPADAVENSRLRSQEGAEGQAVSSSPGAVGRARADLLGHPGGLFLPPQCSGRGGSRSLRARGGGGRGGHVCCFEGPFLPPRTPRTPAKGFSIEQAGGTAGTPVPNHRPRKGGSCMWCNLIHWRPAHRHTFF